MRKKTVRVWMLLAALWGATAGAFADGPLANAKVDVFVLGGGSTFIDEHYFYDAERTYLSYFKVGPKITAGFAVPYGPILCIELSYTYGPNNWVVQNNDVMPRVGVVYPVRYSSGNLSAIIHVPYSKFHFRPYVDGGVEYVQFTPTKAAIKYALDYGFASASMAYINANDKVGITVGFGVERKLIKRLSLRIDLRDHVSGTPGFGIPLAPTAANPAPFIVQGRSNNIVYTAGFVYRLGKL